jgi:polysaccharide export outer membrane protein
MRVSLLLASPLIVLVVCCAPQSAQVPSDRSNSIESSRPVQPSAVSTSESVATNGPNNAAAGSDADLTRIWRAREAEGVGDFPLGPGDLISINCPDDDEFNNQYRISGTGTITLPLVGEVRLEGLTQQQAAASLQQQLKHYLRKPQITLLVTEYHSRQVGVFGAVAKPGVYSLSGPGNTVQDMISLAGGFTVDASPRVQFRPAELALEKKGKSEDGSSQTAVMPTLTMDDAQNAIVVDVEEKSERNFLGMPARPGDIINVAANGQVLVDGWVSKPGAYPISHDLKVLGAIAAAGGALYPAKKDHIKIIRKDNTGAEVLYVDIDRVQSGDATDLAVEDGDVIEVPVSAAKVVPYGVYQTALQLFRAGAYVAP